MKHPVQERIDALCISAAELAEAAGVSRSTLGRVLSWRNKPRAETRRRVIDALGEDRAESARLFPWPPPKSRA